MSIDRRELFTIVGAGVATGATASAQHEHRTPATPVGPYDPRALSASAIRDARPHRRNSPARGRPFRQRQRSRSSDVHRHHT